MNDAHCVEFLQWALPQLRMRWPGFRKVRRQVCKRIDRRLKILGLRDVGDYKKYLHHNPQEWQELDNFCRISISRFYRDRGVFNDLRESVLPKLGALARRRSDRQINCWSAGCASGEEPYTLTIIWELGVRAEYPELDLQIVATDSDEHLLDRARQACFPSSSLKELPKDWVKLAFDERDGMFQLKPDLRRGVRLVNQDIRREMPEGSFNLILCRHLVFTYFDCELQNQVLDGMIDKLRVGGFLVTGKQESLPCMPTHLEQWKPHTGIYRRIN